MRTRTVLEGNAFYEIDEDCLEQKKKRGQKQDSTYIDDGQNNLQNSGNSSVTKAKGRE